MRRIAAMYHHTESDFLNVLLSTCYKLRQTPPFGRAVVESAGRLTDL